MADHEREDPLSRLVHVVDERDERRHVVAFALFAGPDASYVAGVYRPSQVELQLAERLLETLEAVGWTVRRHPEPPSRPLHDRCRGVRAVAGSRRPEQCIWDAGHPGDCAFPTEEAPAT